MASAAEQLAANLNLGVLSKATELKKRIWFTLGALIVFRVGTYIPVPGVDASVMSADDVAARRRHPRHVRHVHRRRAAAHDRLRAEHHALHQRQHHRAADDRGDALARNPEEGGRERAEEAQPVHPLPDGGDRHVPVLRHRRRAREHARQLRAGGDRSRLVLPLLLRHHAGRRHDVPDVAGRADHRARRRQRHQPDHLRRHRRQPADGAGQSARTRPDRRALAVLHPRLHGHRRRRHRLHRVHGAGAAAHRGPVSEAPGRHSGCSAAIRRICR